MKAGSLDVTPTPAPTTTIVIAKAAPVITSKMVNVPIFVSGSGGTFSVIVTGYSTTRDMSTATFHFTAVNGTTLAPPDIPVNVTSAFTNWYSSAASNAFGSEFTMTVQFTFNGVFSPTATVDLTNSAGTSERK